MRAFVEGSNLGLLVLQGITGIKPQLRVMASLGAVKSFGRGR